MDSYRLPGDIQLKITHNPGIYTLEEDKIDGIIGKEKPGVLGL